jgi:hypothetical protein
MAFCAACGGSPIPVGDLWSSNELTGSYVFTFSGGLRRRCPEVGFGGDRYSSPPGPFMANFWIGDNFAS